MPFCLKQNGGEVRGASRRQLKSEAMKKGISDRLIVATSWKWRRERDSNPRYLSVQWFSRPPQSTTLPSLRGSTRGQQMSASHLSTTGYRDGSPLPLFRSAQVSLTLGTPWVAWDSERDRGPEKGVNDRISFSIVASLWRPYFLLFPILSSISSASMGISAMRSTGPS